MEIKVARTAGFCFGVARAVKLCDDMLAEGRKISTLGPIIHNRQVVESLAERGCRAVETPADIEPDHALVIRSHGVPLAVYDECARLGIEVLDATCPFVAKIHDIVAKESAAGKTVLIAGDADHPEVRGIVGHSGAKTYVFDSFETLEGILEGLDSGEECIMVAQTTFNLEKYNEYSNRAKKRYTNLIVFDTICKATRCRQLEANELAKTCDICVVIGGKNSSNTKKLFDVCSEHAKTFSVETAKELTPEMFKGAKTVGVTAGASTPSVVIEEVVNKMTDNIKEEEFNFEQAIEDSLKLVHRGQRCDGTVTEIRPNEVVVDIGTKHTGIVPADELSDDTSAAPSDVVKIGDVLHLIVTKVQDLEGIVTLSKKRVDSEKGFEEIAAAVEDGTVFDAYISEAVNKGLVATIKGVRVFIPASQATLRRGEPYEQLAHTHQKIKIIEATPQRRRAIGSIRAVLEEENKKAREEFWSTVEVGKKYTGAVKSLTSYGAFVDLGGVDGMIHISELSWGRIKNPSEVLKVGDVVEVYVRDIDTENKKVSLGYRKEEDNPWNIIQTYELGSTFEAPVVSVTKFGAFVRILPGIDGLVHISELSSEHVETPADVVKVGDIVKVRLIGVDVEKKRVSLSMRPEGEERKPKTNTERAKENLEHTAAVVSAKADELAHKVQDMADNARYEAKESDVLNKVDDILGAVKEKAADVVDAVKDKVEDLADGKEEK